MESMARRMLLHFQKGGFPAYEEAHEAGAALEDRGHLLDDGTLAPLVVVGMEDAVAETEVEARRHRQSVAGPARPLPAGSTMPIGSDSNPGRRLDRPPVLSVRTPRSSRWRRDPEDVIQATPPACYACSP